MSEKAKTSILREELPRYFLLIATILVFLLFGIMQPKFFNLRNIMNILSTASIVGIMSLGMMISLDCGELNFAAGSTASVAAIIVGRLSGEKINGYLLPVVIALVGCIIVGLISSTVAFRLGISSFIATLGVSKLTDGVTKFLCDNKSFRSKKWPESFSTLGQGKIGPVPVALIVFLLIAVVMWIFMERSRTGKYVTACGTNQTSCRQVGINVTRIKFIAFAISSILCGFSGIVYVSQMNTVSLLAGSDMLMNAIAAAILGATFLKPGKFNVPGTVLSVILLTAIQNGVISIGAPSPAKSLIQGVILIIAIGIIALIRKGGLPNVSI